MRLRGAVLAITSFLLLLAISSWTAHQRSGSTFDRLLLLIPDGISPSDPRVSVWLDASSEEGLHLVAVHDSDFLRPFFPENAAAGVILPDSVHPQASDVFAAAIHQFVGAGGKLMLVYDAGTLSLASRFALGHSRFSDLAGIDYALYDQLHDNTVRWGNLRGGSAFVRSLDIPPGKYYPFEAPSIPHPRPNSSELDFDVQLTRYKYGELLYPSFVTSGNYAGRILLRSAAGVAAGEHTYQKGSVLFVNLPLGYLKSNTDGLLLHAFLKYFGQHCVSLPQLMPVPDGIGGLVLNWHLDSNAAIKPLERMRSWQLARQGPYSIHVTAGPDDQAFGDKKGLDLEHNRSSQDVIAAYASLGNEIGSHGGWIHDYFAAHVEKDAPKDLEQFLILNKNAIEHLVGKPVVEYSAPEGDQPPWVTRWLESHGFVAYYFTGDTGMGPTRGYRNGIREGDNIWAFPIIHLNRAAAFEEMTLDGHLSPEIEHWLEAVTRFTIQHRAVRLIYFHPPGIMEYQDVVRRWSEQTARLGSEGQFRWYTMTELANFLNSRQQVNWKVFDHGSLLTIDAIHPQSLQHQTWRVPSSRFSQPVVVQGSAKVIQEDEAWLVVAGQGKSIRFETRVVSR